MRVQSADHDMGGVSDGNYIPVYTAEGKGCCSHMVLTDQTETLPNIHEARRSQVISSSPPA